MRVWISAVVLVAASCLVAAPRIWPQGGGAQARSASQTATAVPRPSGNAVQTPEQTSSEPRALAHRQTVLQQFACSDCHGVDRGYLMPADHAPMSEGECRNCHRPAPEPPPITLHDNMEHQSTTAFADCGLCHSRFAGQPRPAPATQGLCYQCHGAETSKVLPASHAGRSDATSTCIVCHETRALARPSVPHRIDGWEQCGFCHGPGRLTSLDGAHNSQATSQCLSCHDVVQPPRIYSKMHTLSVENGGCGSCHAPGRLSPLPASHAGRPELLCGLCHQQADQGPPQLPHPLAANDLCNNCHTDGRLGGLPSDHAARTEQMCVICHAERPGGVPAIPHTLQNRAACTDCHRLSSSQTDTRS